MTNQPKIVFINQVRKYHPAFTESELFIPGKTERFCYVLEDKKQPYGVKVDKETCIPEGVYNVTITFSKRFQKDMIQLSNQQDLSVEKDGVRFTGVRVHGGNTVDNTEGCPLVNYQTDHNGKSWESASADVLAFVRGCLDKGLTVKWVISA